ncbi:MAG: RibD family protein [Alphaproteobacteria bacterium]|nr:RibD family protein [Alphaproteobacteria bacterium]
MSAHTRARVTLKLATSLDGKIALANGASKWITGPDSRSEVHKMRAAHEAILTGVGTIIADDPLFTARLDPMPERQPDLIVLDRSCRMPMGAKVFSVTERQVVMRSNRNIADALAGYERVMIEAGAQIAAAAIKANVVDRIEWFRAPIILGSDGLDVIAELGLETLEKAPIFQRTGIIERGADIQESYERIR